MREIQKGIFMDNKLLYTESLEPGLIHFQETTKKEGSKHYRQWDARSSKIASAILKGIKCPIATDSKVLYLGAAHGYSASYASDIAKNGFIYAIDFAPRVVRDLIFVTEKRKNMAAFLADANKPESYYHYMNPVDVIFQDIAQKNQVEIFMKNMNLFLKKDGIGMLAIKARSIDTTQQPKQIFQKVRAELESYAKIIEYRTLDPFQRDHCIFMVKR